ncbi:hypothetical protein FBUS_03063 [Fasciolopsis buskii]|uniref:Uncharacterized protein n=1 Tax=Fasciolopsis buskii TaxID=27845 RepID=A0A8E0VI95_9TREM|nr:hypothetical protein FBUS_03063 [Fasciolopsis buski]
MVEAANGEKTDAKDEIKVNQITYQMRERDRSESVRNVARDSMSLQSEEEKEQCIISSLNQDEIKDNEIPIVFKQDSIYQNKTNLVINGYDANTFVRMGTNAGAISENDERPDYMKQNQKQAENMTEIASESAKWKWNEDAGIRRTSDNDRRESEDREQKENKQQINYDQKQPEETENLEETIAEDYDAFEMVRDSEKGDTFSSCIAEPMEPKSKGKHEQEESETKRSKEEQRQQKETDKKRKEEEKINENKPKIEEYRKEKKEQETWQATREEDQTQGWWLHGSIAGYGTEELGAERGDEGVEDQFSGRRDLDESGHVDGGAFGVSEYAVGDESERIVREDDQFQSRMPESEDVLHATASGEVEHVLSSAMSGEGEFGWRGDRSGVGYGTEELGAERGDEGIEDQFSGRRDLDESGTRDGGAFGVSEYAVGDEFRGVLSAKDDSGSVAYARIRGVLRCGQHLARLSTCWFCDVW